MFLQLGTGKMVLEKVKALQGISLFNIWRTKDAVPAPMLVDGSFFFVQIGHPHQILVQEAILLQVYAMFL